jgi:hypothetical protein
VRRFVDRGAVTAAWVGLGMAVTVVVSFVLVIPIEFLVGPCALLGGMLIGYYANARSERAGGPWGRLAANALLAGVVTGLTYAVLLLAIKAIFFFADTGYPDFNRVDQSGQAIPPYCDTGAPCTYARYLKLGRGPAFEAAGITTVDEFTGFYWREQVSTSGLMITLSVVGALAGGAMFGMANRRRPDSSGERGASLA